MFFPRLSLVAAALLASVSAQRCPRVEAVMLQDFGMRSKWSMLVKQLPSLATGVHLLHPGARFGIGTFSDKPLSGNGNKLGDISDFCFSVNAALSRRPGRSLQSMMRGLLTRPGRYGGDEAQATWEALNRAAMCQRFGWGSTKRVLVVVTEGIAHQAGEGTSLTGRPLRTNDLTFPQVMQNPNFGCADMEYPSVTTVARGLRGTAVVVVSGKQGIADWYVNQLKPQGATVVGRTVSSDYSDIGNAVQEAIAELMGCSVEQSASGIDDVTEAIAAQTSTEWFTVPSMIGEGTTEWFTVPSEVGTFTTTESTTSAAAPTEKPTGDCLCEGCDCCGFELHVAVNPDGSVDASPVGFLAN